MNYIISRKADLRFGNGSWNYTAPAIGHHHYSLQIIERLRMDFWPGIASIARASAGHSTGGYPSRPCTMLGIY